MPARYIIPDNIQYLNKIFTDGFIREGLYIIAGKEAVGKTTFSATIVSDILKPSYLKTGIISENIKPKFWDTSLIINDKADYKRFSFLPLKSTSFFFPDIEDIIKNWIILNSIDVIIIDGFSFFQSLRPKDKRNKNIANTVKRLSTFAKQLKIPLFIPIGFKPTRFSDTFTIDDFPLLNELKEIADVIILMNRKSLFEREFGETEFSTIIKNTSHENPFFLKSNFAQVRFEELSSSLQTK